MGNSLRCWLACVLPCGALDLVRVVHLNGHVDEYSRHITAGEILAANPRHVLSKPCSQSQSQGLVRRRILIVSPESELKRGHIYFLIPGSGSDTSDPEKKKKKRKKTKKAMDENNYLSEILSEKNLGRRMRRRSTDRVSVWRSHLESIDEDPLS